MAWDDTSYTPLIPLLAADQAVADPAALATWHDALSNSLGVDLPHDLLGLWLYSGGGAVLLGPAALAQDDLVVPLPEPYVRVEQMELLEEIIRDARYGSVMVQPIRAGKADVGLVLLADLAAGRYGEAERAMLGRVAHHLAPTFARMARQWAAAAADAGRLEREAVLVGGIGTANTETRTPREYAAALGRALEALLPHDQLELLIPDPSADQVYRLGEHVGGGLWSDPSLILAREHLDIAGLFAERTEILIADTWREVGWPRGLLTAAHPAGADLRSIAGIRVMSGERTIAYLLVGSIAPDLYRVSDLGLLERVGRLVAPKVDGFVLAWELQTARVRTDALDAVPARSARIADTLAATSDLPTATRRVADELAGLVPCDEVRFAIRLSEGDRVVLLEPGETRALPDLPSEPAAGTPLGRVLAGEAPSAIAELGGLSTLIVPLRVAGRITGGLVFRTHGTAAFFPPDIAAAQAAADVIAPHLELLRRAALLPGPMLPGWKRTRS